MSKPEYMAWYMMKRRCLDQADKDYQNYGGRGVVIDGRWQSFDAFLADMGPRPTPAHTLERIENNKGYSAENCRWATRKEQAENLRRTIRVTLNGEHMSLKSLCLATGVHYPAAYHRVKVRGNDPVHAVRKIVLRKYAGIFKRADHV